MEQSARARDFKSNVVLSLPSDELAQR